MRQLRRHGLRAALACLVLAGCTETGEPAESVADTFWTAVQQHDLQRALGVSTTADERRLDALFGDRVITGFSLGETLSNESSALVETSLATSDGGSPLVFNTHLDRFDGGWRVDAEETAVDLRRAGFAAALGEVHEALRDGQRVMTEVLEQGAREAADALRDVLDDMDRALGQEPPP